MSRLVVEINRYHVRVTVTNGEDITTKSLSFNDFQDYRYKEQLEVFFDEIGLKNRSFTASVLSWSGFRSTLIPSSIFEDGSTEHFFQLCFGSSISKDAISFDRLISQGIVNVYELPTWINPFFTSKFPRMVFRHEGSLLIQHVLSQHFIDTRVHITIHSGFFVLCIGEAFKLSYYSTFDYQDVDDVLYHIMFTLQQKELFHKNGTIRIYTGEGVQAELPEVLSTRMTSIDELKHFEVSLAHELIQQSTALCV